MPSTVTQTRPDAATGARHISEPANAIIAKINATRHPNVVKMHDAIDAWVKDANRRGGEEGIEYLGWCAARIEMNRANHESAALGRGTLPKSLEGLGPMDFEAASLRISKAVRVLSGESA